MFIPDPLMTSKKLGAMRFHPLTGVPSAITGNGLDLGLEAAMTAAKNALFKRKTTPKVQKQLFKITSNQYFRIH